MPTIFYLFEKEFPNELKVNQKNLGQPNRGFNKKKMISLSKEKKEMKNVTNFVITTSFVYFFGNVFIPIAVFLRYVFKINSLEIKIFMLFSNTLLFLTQGCSIFIYYKFNSNFRQKFDYLFSLLSKKGKRGGL
jgi:hypothetical protein